MPVIEVRRLSKSYRAVVKRAGLWGAMTGLWRPEYRNIDALREIDLSVERGEFVAFLGPNGAGKTTTLKLLSGVLTPTAGEARVLDYIPWERKNEFRRRFALVMGQKNQLWWDLPAQESFRLHQQIYDLPPADFKKTSDELTELLDVGRLLGRPVRELSLGERMKMELIAALLHNPEVLFLDEPTIGLDVVAQHNIQQFLRRYQQERGTTVLLTSHYMKDVAALCRRVIIIANGKIAYDGSLAGIVDQFSGHKILNLQCAGEVPASEWRKYGEVLEHEPPRIRLKIDRTEVPAALAKILERYTIEDISVDDPPLEEVITSLFMHVAGASEPAV